MFARRHSIVVKVGAVALGGTHPIAIQSMTDTDTADVDATFGQVVELAQAGSELVRVTVNNDAAARAVPQIRAKLDDAGWDKLPLIGDFHFIGHRLLAQNPECVKALAKLRINPGNVGAGKRRDENFLKFIEIARDFGKPVRIGVNAGSLDQELLSQMMEANGKRQKPLSSADVEKEALVASALQSAEAAEAAGLAHDQILLSCKISRLRQVVAVYRELAKKTDYPLHIGLTEAGMGTEGVVLTTSALAILLAEGIGDTIRASLTPAVGGKRTDEVKLCQQILQSLSLRQFSPHVTACPGCGRTTSTFFRELAQMIQTELDTKIASWKRLYPGSENLKLAVMGCVVNGPGESRSADIGISLPGAGESPVAPVFIDGKEHTKLRGDNIAREFMDLTEQYVKRRWRAKDSVSEGS